MPGEDTYQPFRPFYRTRLCFGAYGRTRCLLTGFLQTSFVQNVLDNPLVMSSWICFDHLHAVLASL